MSFAHPRDYRFNPRQPRWPKGQGHGGQWRGTGPGGLKGTTVDAKTGRVTTDDIETAVKAMIEGKEVRLRQPREVSVLLDRFRVIAKEMEAKGEQAPNFDLCRITVKGTNIFCVGNKGVPRLQMPQFSGTNIRPGSAADKLPRNSKGEVNVSDLWREHLRSKDVKNSKEVELASQLRATQREINGVKVAGMMKAMREGKIPDAEIFVSSDNYVLDGHHRWASKVGLDLSDNVADLEMPVERIDMSIMELLVEANTFTEKVGLLGAGFAAKAPQPREFSAKDVSPHARAKLKGILDHYRKMAHPFATCVRDQIKHGLAKDHAERRCAVIKDLAYGTTKWRKGGSKKFSELPDSTYEEEYEDHELDEWLAENPDVHDGLLADDDSGNFEAARAAALSALP